MLGMPVMHGGQGKRSLPCSSAVSDDLVATDAIAAVPVACSFQTPCKSLTSCPKTRRMSLGCLY